MRKNIPGDAITARELIPGAYERRRMVTPRQSNRRAQQRPRLGMRTMRWAEERHTPGHGGRICPVAVRPQQRSMRGLHEQHDNGFKRV